jgi:hypothetical protein
MHSPVRRLLALASISFGLGVANAQAQEINFGVIATDSASTQRERWEPFFRDMEKKTGLTIKSFYAPDYAGVIEAMRFNKVQVAWYGNKAAMEAVDRSNGEVFAQVMYADGTFGYHGLLIAHKDSPYNTRGRRAEEQQVHQLQHRRPQFHVGLSGAFVLCVCQERCGPPQHLQDRAQRQPRRQPAGRAGQTGGRGHQQH